MITVASAVMENDTNSCHKASVENGLKTDISNNRRGKRRFRSASAQILACVIQTWLLVDLGMEMATPTLIIGALHKISADAEPLHMNDEEASWFGSISNMVFLFASLSSGFLQELIGRKGSMIVVNVPRFAGWMTLYFASSLSTMYLAAVVMGICEGLCEASVHSYIGEIGDPRLRGTLASISSHGYFFGTLTTLILGCYFEWRTVVLISSAVPVLAFISLTQIPESPTWLIVRNRLDEAKKSLCWVRGWVSPDEVEEEFQEMVNYVKNSSEESLKAFNSNECAESNAKDLTVFKGVLSTMKAVASKKVLRPLCMVCTAFLTSLAGNVIGITPYMIRELRELGAIVEPKLILVMFQIIFVVGSLTNVAFVRRFGKRRLALLSQGLAVLCILGIGTFCSLAFSSADRSPQLSWIPVALFFFLNFINGVGVRLLPWQLLSEVFPPMGRGFASAISVAFAKLILFTLIKTFLMTEDWLHLSGVMYLYAGVSFFGLCYYYLYLPETEGKTLEQIESYFTKNHDRTEKFRIGNQDRNTLY
nr:PREDICTED: facilitated trehalose transporter Tret1-like isoform X1 [Bemisia tabaci]